MQQRTVEGVFKLIIPLGPTQSKWYERKSQFNTYLWGK